MELFAAPMVDVSSVSGSYHELHPASSLTGSAELEFYDLALSDHFIDLTKTQLIIKAKVSKANSSALGADDKVALVNNSLHSIFSSTRITLNDVEVASSSSNYPLRAYLETLLNHSVMQKESYLPAQHYHMDDNFSVTGPDPVDQRVEGKTVEATHNAGLDAQYKACKMLNVMDGSWSWSSWS